MNEQHSSTLLADQVPIKNSMNEKAWIEVIYKMDQIYADLVHYQVELEDKNSELSTAYKKLNKTYKELKAAQQRLVQSEKMASLGRLVAGVAHELNNPISFVLGNMHALNNYEHKLKIFFSSFDSSKDIKTIKDTYQKLKIDLIIKDLASLIDGSTEGAERISEIVQNLSSFSTPQQQDERVIEVATLIKRTAKWVLRTTKNKVNMVFDLQNNLTVIGKEGYFHQILLNLLQNAADAVSEIDAAQIKVTAKQQKDWLKITVRDNGPGIPADNLLKIFDPFFTTKSVGKGTGLGLYVSYGLATDQCHGELKAKNHLQGGAIFTLRLPLKMQTTK